MTIAEILRSVLGDGYRNEEGFVRWGQVEDDLGGVVEAAVAAERERCAAWLDEVARECHSEGSNRYGEFVEGLARGIREGDHATT